MLKTTTATKTISKAIIGPFKTATDEDAYMTFQAQNPRNVTFLLDPHTEKLLKIYAGKCSTAEELETMLEDRAPRIKSYLKKKYDPAAEGEPYDYSLEDVQIGRPAPQAKDGEVAFQPVSSDLWHSHPGTMGVDDALHHHNVKTSMRLKPLDGQVIKIDETTFQTFCRNLRDFAVERDYVDTGMEEIGTMLFAYMEDQHAEDGILQAVSMNTPYNGDYDHPTTPVIFVTERAP